MKCASVMSIAHKRCSGVVSLCLLGLAIALPCLAQTKDPCKGGTVLDADSCGIRITMNPPLKYPDEDVLWVPNEIMIDIPLRLHPTPGRSAE